MAYENANIISNKIKLHLLSQAMLRVFLIIPTKTTRTVTLPKTTMCPPQELHIWLSVTVSESDDFSSGISMNKP